MHQDNSFVCNLKVIAGGNIERCTLNQVNCPDAQLHLKVAGIESAVKSYIMVVVNRPGGVSTIGVDEVAHAQPDGYTLVYPSVGAVVVQPHYGGLNYKYTDLEPIVHVANEPVVLAVKKGKYKDLDDFVKAKPSYCPAPAFVSQE